MPILSCPTAVGKPLRTLLASRDKSYRSLASRGSAGNYRMEKEYLGFAADSPSKCLEAAKLISQNNNPKTVHKCQGYVLQIMIGKCTITPLLHAHAFLFSAHTQKPGSSLLHSVDYITPVRVLERLSPTARSKLIQKPTLCQVPQSSE